ncbi:glycosyl transferase, group 1 [Afipia carboxidovorans OM5]|uniref:Uncharacterized protein n=1 Tax=Afipia carboxidovorans (strain ATCC 49405 / DSM 1227 / KCTC 32145 / OM5) TaxID=504832 RepID=B6JIJ0_AFIC5|nr:glycosyltransferase family 4 protein [Afipia carboxidovorans]ACI94234.1 glycosyl transferase, group 1 [Afipia carboxidovorans OM5]AEI02118.1 hypothetical protein OCA4_c09720 [Afipia carboxidovorans OM4]AEI05694.1 hypothetical protein OCA5_c09730 [Afipia carboxidovorans OM5]
MKIALITFHADPTRGGAERYTIELAGALTQQGHDVVILHYTPLKSAPAPNLDYTRVGRNRRTKAGQYLAFIDAVDKQITRDHFDIVHAMLPIRRCDIYQPHAGFAIDSIAGNNKKRRGLSRLLARIGSQLNRKRRLYASIELDLLTAPSPPTVICLSEAMKTRISPIIQPDLIRLSVIYNAVDLNHYDRSINPETGLDLKTKLDIVPDQAVALFIAQDFERKGLAPSLKALAEVHDPTLKLIVVGGDNAKPYRRLAETLGIAQSIIFAGEIHDVYPFYAAADFVLFPSSFDPFGLVPAESISMCVPPIVSRQCGVSELLTHNYDALIIEDPSEVSQLVAAIHKILEPNSRRLLASNCVQSRQVFAYKKHLDSILQEYRIRINAL